MVLGKRGFRRPAAGVGVRARASCRAGVRTCTSLAIALVLPAGCEQAPVQQETAAPARTGPTRSVALTFDDLPGVYVDTTTAHMRDVNERLIASLTRAGVHATGFVNENKLRGEAGRAALLDLWLDAGLDLGNHTWGHPDLHRIPLDEFEDAVLRGEVVTRERMAARGLAPRFFRHPFLHTGRDTATRNGLERFLAQHGYRVAPVTIDNYDFQWARAYDRAHERGDSAAAHDIGDRYVAYMDTVFGFYEAQSRAFFGREPAQVLLLHVNRLNADRVDDLLAMMRRRDYAIVPLDRALEDPVYQSRDDFTGPAGISWLHRWALTAGTPGSAFAGEPAMPPEIENAR